MLRMISFSLTFGVIFALLVNLGGTSGARGAAAGVRIKRKKDNQKMHEEMPAMLQGTLNEGQRTRLRRLELQRDGLFGEGRNWKELHATDEQQEQFMALIQQTEKKTKSVFWDC